VKERADRIIQRILDDANARAESIKADARDQAKAIENEAREKASRKEEQILEQAKKDAEEQKRRIIGVAQLEARKDLLAAKQEMIGKAFEMALEHLLNQDGRAYFSMIHDMLLEYVETGTEKVMFSTGDLARIPDNFWQEVNEALLKQGKKGELKLSDEPRDIRGGFILQTDGVEINCSFESLLEMKRDELEPEVAAVLFQ